MLPFLLRSWIRFLNNFLAKSISANIHLMCASLCHVAILLSRFRYLARDNRQIKVLYDIPGYGLLNPLF